MKPKYWAYFESTASYELMTNKENQRLLKDEPGYVDNLRNLEPFETLRAAKQYLLMHFNGEIQDAKRAVQQIKDWKAK